MPATRPVIPAARGAKSQGWHHHRRINSVAPVRALPPLRRATHDPVRCPYLATPILCVRNVGQYVHAFPSENYMRIVNVICRVFKVILRCNWPIQAFRAQFVALVRPSPMKLRTPLSRMGSPHSHAVMSSLSYMYVKEYGLVDHFLCVFRGGAGTCPGTGTSPGCPAAPPTLVPPPAAAHISYNSSQPPVCSPGVTARNPRSLSLFPAS